MATEKTTTARAAIKRPAPASGRRAKAKGAAAGVCRIGVVQRRTSWIVSDHSPKSADDLSFTSRDREGGIVWWDVSPPRTNYWHAHEMLGRAYAFELLDLVNNDAASESRHTVSFIAQAVARWLPTVAGTAATGMADGFFDVLSEFVQTGTADR